jgi:hypothetical protein
LSTTTPLAGSTATTLGGATAPSSAGGTISSTTVPGSPGTTLGEHEVGTGIDGHRHVTGVPGDVSPTDHSLSTHHVSAAHDRSRRPGDHGPPIGHCGLIHDDLELWGHPHR